jgi:hypothetical protein
LLVIAHDKQGYCKPGRLPFVVSLFEFGRTLLRTVRIRPANLN